MGMPARQQYTADMVRRLNAREPQWWPRYEVVDGELLVTPAPRKWHYEVASRIEDALRTYLGHEPVGRVYHSPSGSATTRSSYSARSAITGSIFAARRAGR